MRVVGNLMSDLMKMVDNLMRMIDDLMRNERVGCFLRGQVERTQRRTVC